MTVRYGLIGTGTMGHEHIGNLTNLAGAQITAVADPYEPSRRGAVAAIGGGVAAYEDYRDLLDAGGCDAVVISTPNMTHVDVLLDVLETDLHILVEKPLCTTVEDCRRVIAASTRPDRVVWVGLEYRYMPPVARLIERVRDGAVGTPRMVAIREHRFPFLAKVGDWNRFRENTGGTLVEKCCHFFDLMNLIVGTRPTRVFASGAQDVNHLDEDYGGRAPDVIDNVFVVVDYEGGARAMLDLCMFAEATRDQEEVSVVGELGKVEALVPSNELRTGRRGVHPIGHVDIEIVHDERIAFAGGHSGSSYIEHLEFLDAVTNGKPAAVSLEDGLWSVAVGEAGHRSIDEGRVVTLDEILGG